MDKTSCGRCENGFISCNGEILLVGVSCTIDCTKLKANGTKPMVHAYNDTLLPQTNGRANSLLLEKLDGIVRGMMDAW